MQDANKHPNDGARAPSPAKAARVRMPVGIEMLRGGYIPLVLSALIAVFAVVLGAGPRISHAQEAITVSDDTPTNEFPRGVTFNLEFQAPAAVKEVRLRSELAPDGTEASAVAECTGTITITCSHTLISGAGIFVIPGANITYHWDIEDEDGNKLSTPEKLYVHEDTRFTFETVSEGNVTVYYHSGRLTQAQAVLGAAVETIERVGALEQTTIPFPVKVFLYQTAEEMGPAIASGGSGRGVSILGEVAYSDTAMVSADSATLDIARHEVAHIVTREATKGPFGIPDWMNEGISVFSQSEPLAGHDSALQSAINSDRVLSFKELNSSSAGDIASTVGLYYGQSGSIIGYLVNTYGEAKFAELLKTFKEGSTDDKAFESVYGFDQLGLENEWRASVGLDPRTASATATPRATEETRPIATAPASNGSTADGSDGGAPVVMIAIIVAIAALALAALGGVAIMIMRKQ